MVLELPTVELDSDELLLELLDDVDPEFEDEGVGVLKVKVVLGVEKLLDEVLRVEELLDKVLRVDELLEEVLEIE